MDVRRMEVAMAEHEETLRKIDASLKRIDEKLAQIDKQIKKLELDTKLYTGIGGKGI